MLETLVISSILGREVISHTIGEATKSAYLGIGDLLSNENFHFKELIESLDIKLKIEIINDLVDRNKDIKVSKSIKTCFDNLHSIITKINEEITNVNEEIKIHSTKWFKSFRSSGVLLKINNLKRHSIILDNRLDMLIKLLNINY